MLMLLAQSIRWPLCTPFSLRKVWWNSFELLPWCFPCLLLVIYTMFCTNDRTLHLNLIIRTTYGSINAYHLYRGLWLSWLIKMTYLSLLLRSGKGCMGRRRPSCHSTSAEINSWPSSRTRLDRERPSPRCSQTWNWFQMYFFIRK